MSAEAQSGLPEALSAPSPPRSRELLPAPFIAWFALSMLAGERRWELCAVALLAPALAYGGGAARRLLVGAYPLALVGIAYDSQGLLGNLGVSVNSVHTCDLAGLDRTLFGVGAGAARVTLPAFLQDHGAPALDLVAAVPYAAFAYVVVAYAVHLWKRDEARLSRFAWSFLAMNLLAFATYRIFPAAPPWYIHAHGCAVDLSVGASEGPALARVDAMLGVSYFHAFYSRSRDVFGAFPSLHVGYPLLITLEGWRHAGRAGRVLSAGFFAWMCAAALYLDHHWVTDVLAGAAYAVLGHRMARAVERRRLEPRLLWR